MIQQIRNRNVVNPAQRERRPDAVEGSGRRWRRDHRRGRVHGVHETQERDLAHQTDGVLEAVSS